MVAAEPASFSLIRGRTKGEYYRPNRPGSFENFSYPCDRNDRGMLVGATGFEPATPCAQGRCATRLRYAPTLNIIDSTADFRSSPFACLARLAKNVARFTTLAGSFPCWTACSVQSGRIDMCGQTRSVSPYCFVATAACL